MNYRFKCNLCSATFELRQEVVQGGTEMYCCDRCGNLCQVQQSQSLNVAYPGAVQLHGCELVGAVQAQPLLGVVDTEEFECPVEATQVDREEATQVDLGPQSAPAPKESMLAWIQEEAESKEEAALEGVVSQWRVTRESGQTYSFHFLVALRKWIMDGRITAGDHLLTSGGAEYVVEAYPGTADLFQNLTTAQKRRTQVLNRKRRRQFLAQKFRQFKYRRVEILLVTMLLISAMFFAGQFGWQHYAKLQSITRAETYLHGLKRLNLEPATVTDPKMISAWVWSDQEGAIQDAIGALTAQISRYPQNLEATCLLAESFSRRAAFTGNLSELTLARNLLDYLGKHAAEASCLLRAEAVYHWSQGHDESARAYLRRYLAQSQDPYGFYIHALLELDNQNSQAAKNRLAQAIELLPNNTNFLLAHAKIFEQESKWDQAIALVNKALEIEPGNVTMIKRLARYYESSGDLFATAKTYKGGVQISEDPAEFQFLLVAFYRNHNDYEETIRAANHYLERYPDGQHATLVQQFHFQAEEAISSERQQGIDEQRQRLGLTGNTRRRLWIRR